MPRRGPKRKTDSARPPALRRVGINVIGTRLQCYRGLLRSSFIRTRSPSHSPTNITPTQKRCIIWFFFFFFNLFICYRFFRRNNRLCECRVTQLAHGNYSARLKAFVPQIANKQLCGYSPPIRPHGLLVLHICPKRAGRHSR